MFFIWNPPHFKDGPIIAHEKRREVHHYLQQEDDSAEITLHIDSVSRDLMRIRQTMAELLARHSGHTLEEVYEKTAKDTYFEAEEAVAWGLADRVTHEI